MVVGRVEVRCLLGGDGPKSRSEEPLLGGHRVGDEQVEVPEGPEVAIGIQLGDGDALEHDRVLIERTGDDRDHVPSHLEARHRLQFGDHPRRRDGAVLRTPVARRQQLQAVSVERRCGLRALGEPSDRGEDRRAGQAGVLGRGRVGSGG